MTTSKSKDQVTRKYHNCIVQAFKRKQKEHPYPWCFTIEHKGVVHQFAGSNWTETKAAALKRAWYRAKWLSEGTYYQRYQ